MEENAEIKKVIIEDQLKEAYLDYAMSVIVGRALPDVRDGLKPVHRRILTAMNEMGLQHNKRFTKCAGIVGDCLKKYHPHGDASVYDALVRLGQEWNLRYTLIIGQGNWGCFTKDTKIKLLDGSSKSFEELCKIYKKNDVFYVYSINKNGEVTIGEASNPRLTKEKSKIIELTLDNGKKIRCTPEHKFLLKDLSYKEAQYLTSEDSLMPGYFTLSPIKGNTELKEYLMIKDQKKEKYIFIHELADKFNLAKDIYQISNGSVRHHVDFNKFNNKPDNIIRVTWKKHTEIHNSIIKEKWKDPIFRKKQSDGVRNFYKNNPEHIEKLRVMLRRRNKDPEFRKRGIETRKKIWQDPIKRQELSKKIKANFEKNPERRIKQSEYSKKMWANPFKRQEIIAKTKEINNTPEIKEKRSKQAKEYFQKNPEAKKLISERSKNLWKNKNFRDNIIKKNKEIWQNPEFRKRFLSRISNRTYKTDSEYFSAIGKKAWEKQGFWEMQSEKSKKQWKDETFRNKIINAVKERNKKRLEQNPDFMKKLAEKAAERHKINWKNPEYKSKIIKNKILYYVNRLILQVGEENINEFNYNKLRNNNCFPKFSNAIKHFKDVNEMIYFAKEYNHYIISIKTLDYAEDVYDITVKEHRNFLLDCGVFVHNSIDGDPAGAYRYTEAKLHKLAEEMLEDIEKETVNFIPNFDGSLTEPVVLPSKIPNLLINGSSGIAVGMATNIPPHNIGEIIDGTLLVLENPNLEFEELLKVIKGPDFPTGALIYGNKGIVDAYKTGRGKLIIRAKTELEDNKIIVKEIPYQTNKSLLIEGMANAVKEGIIEGIKDIRDETDKHGIRIIIDLKKDTDPKLILNQLYKHSGLQSTFGVIMLSLVDNEPKILNLKQIIEKYISHRKEVITRRTKFDLNKAEEKSHILEGLKIALSNIDKVIQIIKNSENTDIAKKELSASFTLTEKQSLAILDMKLHKLTNLETSKITKDLEETNKLIQDLKSILASGQKIIEIIKKELIELKEKYTDKRRTQIIAEEAETIIPENLIKEEKIVVTLTYSGYIKHVLLTSYKQQNRGGKGVQGTSTKDEEDLVQNLIVASNLSTLMFFTNKGKVFWLKGYEIPESSRYGKGKAIVNLLNLEENEKVNALVSVKDFANDFLVFTTKKGLIKKTKLEEYSSIRKSGLIAINLKEKDEVVKVILVKADSELMLTTKLGKAIRFNEKEVREVSRNSKGVRGIKLKEHDELIGLQIVSINDTILTVTEKGFGKRTKVEEYTITRRGGKGIRNIKVSEKNSFVVSTSIVQEDEELIIMTKKGQTIRLQVNQINTIGRNTSGVHLIKLNENDSVANIAKISKE